MARRDGYLSAYWIDPLLPDLESKRKRHPRGKRINATTQPEEAVFIIRDRIGFKYERKVGLTDFVSQREAAELLSLAVMTVNRWVRDGELPSHSRNGFSVIKFEDLVRFATKKDLLDPNNLRTRIRVASLDEVIANPDFSGFASELGGQESMYMHLNKNVKTTQTRGRKPPR
jgi:excisionase family DNA binding protein